MLSRAPGTAEEFARGNSQNAPHVESQMTLTREPDSCRDVGDSVLPSKEESVRPLDSAADYILMRGHPCRYLKPAGEVVRAQIGNSRETG